MLKIYQYTILLLLHKKQEHDLIQPMRSVRYALENSKRLIMNFHKYQREEREYIENALSLYLNNSALDHLCAPLSYCIHEMAMNACKANTKRVFFRRSGLLIHDPIHYETGMEVFRKKILSNLSYYNKIKREENIQVEFQIKQQDNRLSVSVINSFPLTREEKNRIEMKILLAARHSSVADALTEAQDPTEGAGLGIISILSMIRDTGLPDNSFKIFNYQEKTHATLSFPLSPAACL